MQCESTFASCRCSLREGHEEPFHVCECSGSWVIDRAGLPHAYTLPDVDWKAAEGVALTDSDADGWAQVRIGGPPQLEAPEYLQAAMAQLREIAAWFERWENREPGEDFALMAEFRKLADRAERLIAQPVAGE